MIELKVSDHNPADDMLTFMSQVVAGALVVQLARTENPSNLQQLPSNNALLRRYADKLSTLGLDPETTAQFVLESLQVVFTLEDNAVNMQYVLSKVLWDALGDPSSGDPPAIYRDAAKLMHRLFVGTLDPSFPRTPQ